MKCNGQALLETAVGKVLEEMRERPIPLGISNRHIHLSAQDFAHLFPGQSISVKKALMQPDQYAAEQTLTLVGPKGKLEKVRLLGPLRSASQVEVSVPMPVHWALLRHCGCPGPARNTRRTVGQPFAELEITSGVIVAQRHIHMSPLDALILNVSHGDKVSVAIKGDERRLIFDNVAVRVSPDMRLEMHIDTDEANAAGADNPQVCAMLVNKS